MTSYPDAGRAADGSRDIETRRQLTIDRLTDAFSSDLLSMDEYERRVEAVNAARSLEAVDGVLDGLPAARGPYADGASRGSPARRDSGSPSYQGSSPNITACIMSDRRMTGNWLTGDRVSSFTLMGSTKLDLSDVDLPSGPLRIEAFSLMGETKVFVPRGVPVRMNVFAFMGDTKVDRDVNQQVRGADTWIELSGFAMMSEVSVHVAR